MLVGETLVQVSEEFSDAVVPPIRRCFPAEHPLEQWVPLHVRIDFLQKRIDVSPVIGGNGALKGLHVLLRHRPLSIVLCRDPTE
jgi:hypothetical protein